MASKQRVAARASKADRSDKIMKRFSDSDDEAPEEVTFEDSKVQALRSVKQAQESARREKDLLKEKRKKRQALFKEQKERKLLSAKLLEEIGSSRKQQKAKATKEDEAHRKEKTKRQKPKHFRKLSGNYKVTTVKPPTLASFQQKAADDFLHSRLYGAERCRTTNNQLLSLQNKTASTKGAAFCFVRSQWAPERKRKAEKQKQRWIHKQVPSG